MCVQMIDVIKPFLCGLDGLVVSALDFLVGCCGFESRSSRDNFQTISTPSLYLTCPGWSIKWTRRYLVADSGTKCVWVIHESKAVQIHVHNNRRCFYVPRVLFLHIELLDGTPLCGDVAATINHDGGQDADGVKHRQISHGLACVQRVGGRGLRHRPTTSLQKSHGWMAITRAVVVQGGITLCLLLVKIDDKEEDAWTVYKC